METGARQREKEQVVKHLDEFLIQEYRGLRDVRLEGLGQINLLVGDNNSGKTSILEALYLYAEPLNWRRWSDVASLRETESLASSSQTEQVSWLFPQGIGNSNGNVPLTKPEILFIASGNFPVRKVSCYYENFTEFEQMKYPRLAEGEGVYEEREKEVEGIKIYVSATIMSASNRVETLKETFIFPPKRRIVVRKIPIPNLPVQIISTYSHRMNTTTTSLWSDVINAETKSDAIELLRSFDPDIEDIDIIIDSLGRPTVSVKHKKLRRAPLSTFGDGLRRIFTLATAIPGVRNGLLLIDELEMAIHTGVLKKTFDWLVKACIQNNVQLFATTHSLEAIDTLLDVSEETIELVAYRLRKGEDRITVTRFDKELLSQLREELGLEVR